MPDHQPLPLIDLGARTGFTRHIGGVVTTEKLLSRCGVRPSLRILEVGCGTGRTSAHLARRIGCRVVASDAHPGMLPWVHRQLDHDGVAGRVEVAKADVLDLPWPNDTFDVTICESVLVLVDDKARALGEMARVTRPGGVVGLNEGTLTGPGQPPESIADYASETLGGIEFERSGTWAQLLEGAGLVEVSAEEHPFRVTDELRSIISWIGIGEYLRMIGRLAATYRDEPELREMISGSLRAPRQVTSHMGAGIYVGEVPVG